MSKWVVVVVVREPSQKNNELETKVRAVASR